MRENLFCARKSSSSGEGQGVPAAEEGDPWEAISVLPAVRTKTVLVLMFSTRKKETSLELEFLPHLNAVLDP